jgi:hypothetical protein
LHEKQLPSRRAPCPTDDQQIPTIEAAQTQRKVKNSLFAQVVSIGIGAIYQRQA